MNDSSHKFIKALTKQTISLLSFGHLFKRSGGAKQDRTADLLRARQALSQLSYSPIEYRFTCACNHEIFSNQGKNQGRLAC